MDQPPVEDWRNQSPWKEIGDLPCIKLEEIFLDGKALARAVFEVENQSAEIIKKYKGELARLSNGDLVKALTTAEDIETKTAVVQQFAYVLRDSGFHPIFAHQLLSNVDTALRPLASLFGELDSLGAVRLQTLH